MDVSRLVLAPGRLKAFHREAVEDQAGQVCGTRGKDHGDGVLPREMLCYSPPMVRVCISGSVRADLGSSIPDSTGRDRQDGKADKVEAGDGCLGSLGKRRGRAR